MKIDLKDIHNFIKKQQWIFSKTYAKTAPHEYIYRGRVNDDEGFNNLVMMIRRKGFRARFGFLYNTYLEIDGYYYWTMGNPLSETTIINRCRVVEYPIKDTIFGKVMEWKENGY